MKEKLQKEIARLGSTHVDHSNLKTIEAVSMSVVAILAIAVGTMFGDLLF